MSVWEDVRISSLSALKNSADLPKRVSIVATEYDTTGIILQPVSASCSSWPITSESVQNDPVSPKPITFPSNT